MTKIAISPNVNGTGTFTLAAPDSNTDRTLTLPDAGGEVLTDTSDIEAQVKTATSATGAAPIFACRAFVNFNGTGTVAIRASGNVSSITDAGVGLYTVNFTAAMPSVNYSATASTNDSPSFGARGMVSHVDNISSSACRITIRRSDSSNGARTDTSQISLSVFR